MSVSSQPTDDPIWAENDVVDPTSGENNVITPSVGKQNTGFLFKEFPPRQDFNWFMRFAGRWNTWFKELADSMGQGTGNTTANTVLFDVNGFTAPTSRSCTVTALGSLVIISLPPATGVSNNGGTFNFISQAAFDTELLPDVNEPAGAGVFTLDTASAPKLIGTYRVNTGGGGKLEIHMGDAIGDEASWPTASETFGLTPSSLYVMYHRTANAFS